MFCRKFHILRWMHANFSPLICRRGCFYLFVLLAVSACTAKAPPPVSPPRAEISRIRYSIQAGAFSSAENAIRLTRSLEQKGLNASYFRGPSGLFSVRFGDFATETEAIVTARSLMASGLIKEYYIVSPDKYPSTTMPSDTSEFRTCLIETAERFIGLPYQWGGTSSNEGLDCSGLVMSVYQLNGLNLPRSSQDQFKSGKPVDRDKIKKGDLVFFSFVKGKGVSHVGMYVGDDAFIHAPGHGKTIRKDSLSTPHFAKRFAGARTYLW